MHQTLRRQLAMALLVVVALLSAACSGDSADDSADDTADDTSSDSTVDTVATSTPQPEPSPVPIEPVEEEQQAEEQEEPEEADTGTEAGADTDAETAADAAAESSTSSLTPTDELLSQLSAISFGIDPTQAEIDCMQVYFTYELAAGRTYFSVADPTQELDDQGLRDLAYASNGCINSEALYGWAIGETGVTDNILDNGPACLTTWFGDETWGDTVFHSFTALTFQYRLDPDVRADLTNALVDCAPVASLWEFFATQAESSSGFTIEVDRQCFFDEINNDDVSLAFWAALVEGTGAPVDVMDPYIDACSETFEEPAYTAVPDDFGPFSGARQLATVDPTLRNGLYTAPPALTVDPNGSYEAVLATDGGEVRITLLADVAPNTVNNFVNLANDGYYDGLSFHRVIDDFMAQGGDPTGDGTGGPGYSFADEFDNNPPLDRKGILAMANSGPDTNGSQFFITTAPTEWLNGLHTVFGVVTSGQEYIDAIAARDPLVPTARAQIIDSITIIES